MMKNMLLNCGAFALSALGLTLLAAGGTASAAENAKVEKSAKPTAHTGKLVSIADNKLVMTSKDGERHFHSLTANTEVSCDGKICKAEDLKAGMKIRVTTRATDAKLVTRIEAIVKTKSFVDTHDGEVVNATAARLVMTNKDGQEHSHTLTADVKITCDGEVCKTSDLKPGMKIRVTSECDTPHTVTQIEAIVKNLKFASL